MTGLEVGAAGGPVDEHDDVGVPGLDRGDGVFCEHDPRTAAHAGAIDPRGSEPEVLADLDRRHEAHAGGAETVDVVLGESGVRDRS